MKVYEVGYWRIEDQLPMKTIKKDWDWERNMTKIIRIDPSQE